MKLKEYLYMVGFRARPRHYGYRVDRYALPKFGAVEYAQWLHPRETKKELRAEAVEALAVFLQPGDFCIDIGAHTGDTALPMALAVGKQGLVLALEPNPFVFPTLNKNAVLNRELTRITPLMLAATSEDGDLRFEYSDAGFCNGGRHERISRWRHGHAFPLRVTGVNLQALLLQRYSDWLPKLRYLKVDAEGFDLTILKSLDALLGEQRPFVQAEVYRHLPAAQRFELYDFFGSRGYAVHRAGGGGGVPLRGPRLGRDEMATGHFDIFCDPSPFNQLTTHHSGVGGSPPAPGSFR